MTKLKTGVLISGRGSNLQALIDAAAQPDYPAQIALVISNLPGAYGLERAQAAGIPALTVNHSDYPDKHAFEAALDEALTQAGVKMICLAGFMRLLSAQFVEKWAGRIINIHPSLLPEFKGLHTHERAIAAGKSIHGCTVHYVTAGMDEGPTILQGTVPVLPGDTPETLATRLLPVEHRTYVEGLRLVASELARQRAGLV
jgi:phosphoribosylglycinamide formyltransferase-1